MEVRSPHRGIEANRFLVALPPPGDLLLYAKLLIFEATSNLPSPLQIAARLLLAEPLGGTAGLQPRLKDITAQCWRYSILALRGAVQPRCHRPPAASIL